MSYLSCTCCLINGKCIAGLLAFTLELMESVAHCLCGNAHPKSVPELVTEGHIDLKLLMSRLN